jgi:hypothetical protein
MGLMTDDKNTPEAIENNEAKKNWDKIHSARQANKTSRAEEDVAWARREKAQSDYEQSRKPKDVHTEMVTSEDGELNF